MPERVDGGSSLCFRFLQQRKAPASVWHKSVQNIVDVLLNFVSYGSLNDMSPFLLPFLTASIKQVLQEPFQNHLAVKKY